MSYLSKSKLISLQKWIRESHSVVSNSLWPHELYSPWNSPGQNTGVNPGLPHCRQILYQLSHKGRPRIWEWVAYPVCRGSSQPKNQTRVSCIAGKFFTNWAMKVRSEVGRSCATLCDPMYCSLAALHLQHFSGKRALEWVAISFSRGSSWLGDRTQVSHITGRQTLYSLSHQGSPNILPPSCVWLSRPEYWTG